MNLKFYLFFCLLFSIKIYSQYEIRNIYNKDSGLLYEEVKQINQDKIGFLYIITKDGLLNFDGNYFNKIYDKKINSILTRNHKIYLGTDKGLLIKSDSVDVFIKSNKINNLRKINEDIYVATEEGVYILKNKNLVSLSLGNQIDNAKIFDIISLNKRLYIASDKGIYSSNLNFNINQIELISENSTKELDEYNNTLIASSKNKISFFKNDTLFEEKVFNNISSIQKINNQLWVSSKKEGIEIYSLPSFSFQKKINKYNSTLPNNINSLFKGKQDNIWISTDKGIYKLSKTNNSLKNKKPKVYFENLLINNIDKTYLLRQNKSLSIPYSNNFISIRFKSVDFNNSKNIYYRYKINNHFSNWTNTNNIQLANLSHGKYQIQVQSKVNDVESDFKQLNFTIETPLYLNVYFILGCFIFLIIITYLLVEKNIKKLKKENDSRVNKLKLENKLLDLKQKALQLQMNPHFIFNVLNGIKALGNSGKTKELNFVISNFSNLLRGILHNSKKDNVCLAEELELIKNYVSLEEKISTKVFDLKIETQISNIDEVLIPSMLLQPFVENCIKHAFTNKRKGLIEIKIKEYKKQLKFEIIDNGIGLKNEVDVKSKLHNSLALEITKNRLKNISKYNNFSIDTIKTNSEIKGTIVKFQLPKIMDY